MKSGVKRLEVGTGSSSVSAGAGFRYLSIQLCDLEVDVR